jgi:hypothetical protein
MKCLNPRECEVKKGDLCEASIKGYCSYQEIKKEDVPTKESADIGSQNGTVDYSRW